MAIRNISTDLSPSGRAVLVEAYRRAVEIDAALTEAVSVDAELHRWCEGRLSDLLALLEPYAEDASEPKTTAN